MKYRVTVPAPKAKRMAENTKLIITLHTGWEFDELVQSIPEKKEIPLKEFGSVEFEVPDRHEWEYSGIVKNGWSFTVIVEYKNSTGSRQEEIRLVPEKIGR